MTIPECTHECPATVRYVAAPGERNDVTASERDLGVDFGGEELGSEITITDAGAPISAGSSCRSADAHTAICGGALVAAAFHLGDRDDRLDASRVQGQVIAYGGSGDDFLIGGPGGDILDGGRGHNVLDGRGGLNFALFDDRGARGLRVDLRSRAPQGARGSRDVLRNIENVDALRPRGAVLIGDGQRNQLFAGPYGQVYGGGDHDELFVGSGGRIFGGAGSDSLQGDLYAPAPGNPGRPLSDPAAREFDCGPGRDSVDESRPQDLVRQSCETITPDDGSLNKFILLHERPGATRPLVTLNYGCEIEQGCPLTIAARLDSLRGEVVAARHVYIPYERSGTTYRNYGLFLSPAGRALVHSRGEIRVVIYYHEGPYRRAPTFTPVVGFSALIYR